MFDVESPPTTYKKFRKEVLRSVEEAEVEPDEEYDLALFLVNRKNQADIVTTTSVIEELNDEDEEGFLDLDEIPEALMVHKFFPHKIQEFNTKFFAIVFQATHENNEGAINDIVVCMLGSGPYKSSNPDIGNLVGELDLLKAIIYEEDEQLGLEPWEEIPHDTFSELVVPYKRAVSLRG